MKHYHFRDIGSTNDYALELLDSNQAVVVTADFQSKGRGRNQHNWVGSFGENVYFSYGTRHAATIGIDELIKYQSIGCLAALNILVKFCGEDRIKLKYPNDVFAFDGKQYRKIAGVLIDHTFSGSSCTKSVIGIGINVQQSSFVGIANNNPISLRILGYSLTPNELIEPLIHELERLMSFSPSQIAEIWASELNIIGRDIALVGDENQWYAKELLEDSRLLLSTFDNQKEKIVDNADSIRYDIG